MTDELLPMRLLGVTAWYALGDPAEFEVTDANGESWHVVEGDEDWNEALAIWRKQPTPEKIQEDMIERLRACVAAWLGGRSPEELAALCEKWGLAERSPELSQHLINRAIALRALQPDDRGIWE